MASEEITAPILVLVGPTAVGKTELSLQLADRFQAEIVNVDSMQVYRYLDIGTAKPNKEELQRVRHHLIDIVDPDEHYDAAAFARDARAAVKDIIRRGKMPLFTGGTGLYLLAFLYGIFEIGDIPGGLRKKIKQRLKYEGRGVLHLELQQVDPESAARIHRHDTQRLVRALEIYYATGTPWSVHLKRQRASEKRCCYANVLQVALDVERSTLYERINRRTRIMVEQGLREEVEKLLHMGYGPALKPMQAIGYRHLVNYLQGRWEWDQTIDLLARDTRRYAKRQFTWFRRRPELEWFARDDAQAIENRVNAWLQR